MTHERPKFMLASLRHLSIHLPIWVVRQPRRADKSGAKGLQLSDRVVSFLRSANPVAITMKGIIKAMFRSEAPAVAVYNLLASERRIRRLLVRNIVRATYYQPLLRSMCVTAGQRLMLHPGTGLPVIYGIAVELGSGVHVSGLATFSGALRKDGRRPRLTVGDESHLGHRLTITADDEVTIGSHVHVADDVYICAYDAHPLDPIARRTHPGEVDYSGASRIVIEDDVWICHGAIVLKGVRIGRGAVVGAHSVVTKDVPPGAVVYGNPAVIAGGAADRDREEESPAVAV